MPFKCMLLAIVIHVRCVIIGTRVGSNYHIVYLDDKQQMGIRHRP